jgi:hypothetical protein
MVVYKYPLTLGIVNELDLPRGAQVVGVREQRETVCVWMLIDPDAAVERRHFVCVGTGHTIPKIFAEGEPIGMALLEGGSIVVHVLEVTAAAVAARNA